MTIQEIERNENGVQVSINGKTITVYKFAEELINVLQHNASNKAFGRMGKLHHSWEVAFAAYKSPEMKAAITYAKNTIG